MQDKRSVNFWLGNAVLVLAFLMLLNMNQLWEQLGVTAMVLWAVLAGLGAYLLLSDKDKPD